MCGDGFYGSHAGIAVSGMLENPCRIIDTDTRVYID